MKLIKRGGTVLLGLERVIERITGHALAAELAQRTFDPVGMTNSTYPGV